MQSLFEEIVVEVRTTKMSKRKALRMGFIPFQPDLFGNVATSMEWKREIKRPKCFEYWNPERPGKIRRLIQKG